MMCILTPAVHPGPPEQLINKFVNVHTRPQLVAAPPVPAPLPRPGGAATRPQSQKKEL